MEELYKRENNFYTVLREYATYLPAVVEEMGELLSKEEKDTLLLADKLFTMDQYQLVCQLAEESDPQTQEGIVLSHYGTKAADYAEFARHIPQLYTIMQELESKVRCWIPSYREILCLSYLYNVQPAVASILKDIAARSSVSLELAEYFRLPVTHFVAATKEVRLIRERLEPDHPAFQGAAVSNASVGP